MEEASDLFYVEALISQYFRTKSAPGYDTVRMNSTIHGLFLISIILAFYAIIRFIATPEITYVLIAVPSFLLFFFTLYVDSRLAEDRAYISLVEGGGKKFGKFILETIQRGDRP